MDLNTRIKMTKEKVDNLYDCSFDIAKKWKKVQFWLEISLLSITLVALYFDQVVVYISLIVGLLIRVGIFVVKKNHQKFEQTGHNLQEFSMLFGIYKSFQSFQTEMAYKLAVVPSKYHDSSTWKCQNSGSEYTHDELILKVQENCFFNYHLFKVLFNQGLVKLISGTLIAMVVIFLAYFWHYDGAIDRFRILNFVLLLSSATIVWDELNETIKFKRGFEEMKDLEYLIASEKNTDTSYSMLMFSKYTRIKMNTPQIPLWVYSRNKTSLNSSWSAKFDSEDES